MKNQQKWNSKPARRRNARTNPRENILDNVPRIGRYLIGGFPAQLAVQLRFRENANRAHTGGTVTSAAYSCNSLFTPSPTVGSSHQPLYFDQYSPIYTQYRVVRSEIRVRFTNSTIADSVACVLSNDSDTSVPTSIDVLAERIGAQNGIMGHYQGSNNTAVFKGVEFTPEKYLGCPSTSTGNQAGVGSDPTDQYFWITSGNSMGSTTGNFATEVEINYWVVFSQPKTISGS